MNQLTAKDSPRTAPHHPDFPPGDYPIIYIRGFALGLEAIQATTETPFMGFNLGATKDRQAWDGQIRRLVFASPLIRLMEDHGYRAQDIDPRDVDPGQPGQAQPNPSLSYRPRSIIVHRYYDAADPDFTRPSLAAFDTDARGCRRTASRRDRPRCGE